MAAKDLETKDCKPLLYLYSFELTCLSVVVVLISQHCFTVSLLIAYCFCFCNRTRRKKEIYWPRYKQSYPLLHTIFPNSQQPGKLTSYFWTSLFCQLLLLENVILDHTFVTFTSVTSDRLLNKWYWGGLGKTSCKKIASSFCVFCNWWPTFFVQNLSPVRAISDLRSGSTWRNFILF